MPESPTPPPITGRRRVWLPIIAAGVAAVAVGILIWAFLSARPLSYRLDDPASQAERSGLVDSLAAEIHGMQKERDAEGPDSALDRPLERLRLVWAIELFRLRQGEFPENTGTLAAAGLLPDTRLIDRYAFEVRNGRWKLRDRETNRTIATGN